jgi:hypothetical protein
MQQRKRIYQKMVLKYNLQQGYKHQIYHYPRLVVITKTDFEAFRLLSALQDLFHSFEYNIKYYDF